MEREHQYYFMIGYLQSTLERLVRSRKIDKQEMLSLRETIEKHEISILPKLKQELDKLKP